MWAVPGSQSIQQRSEALLSLQPKHPLRPALTDSFHILPPKRVLEFAQGSMLLSRSAWRSEWLPTTTRWVCTSIQDTKTTQTHCPSLRREVKERGAPNGDITGHLPHCRGCRGTDLGRLSSLSFGFPRATRSGGGCEASTGGVAPLLDLLSFFDFFSPDEGFSFLSLDSTADGVFAPSSLLAEGFSPGFIPLAVG